MRHRLNTVEVLNLLPSRQEISKLLQAVRLPGFKLDVGELYAGEVEFSFNGNDVNLEGTASMGRSGGLDVYVSAHADMGKEGWAVLEHDKVNLKGASPAALTSALANLVKIVKKEQASRKAEQDRISKSNKSWGR